MAFRRVCVTRSEIRQHLRHGPAATAGWQFKASFLATTSYHDCRQTHSRQARPYIGLLKRASAEVVPG